jgi:alpha-glucosidase (family GH31 glycosyl hydrolase)
MKKLFILIMLIFGAEILSAQNPYRIYKSHKEENGIFSVTTNDGKYIFQFYNNNILETTFIPTDEIVSSDSHAVVLKPAEIETTYSYEEDVINFASEGLSVSVTISPFQISYDFKGKQLISEKEGYYKSAHEPMELVKSNIVADSTEKISFNLTKDEVLYGGGARALGMNRRGYRLPLFNRAHYGYETHSELMNYTLPIVLSSKQYLLHFDNAPVGYLDLDSSKDNTLTYETISGRKTYQIIAGETWEEIIHNYTDLTGKQPMPPRWALGNFASRFGYHSQKETLQTIADFKKENIPVDAIILDLYWFGKEIKGTMGNLKFYPDSFPRPKQMIQDLKKQKIETILITEPFILTTSNRWDEAVKKKALALDTLGKPARYDFYFGNTGIVDLYKPEGYNWFKDIYKGLSEMGVNGFWGDLGEPEVHPNWVQHATGSAPEVHNTYGHDWAKLVYEASLESMPERRPFILMRAGYSGSQRFGMIPWSGDVNRTWGGLQSQPEIALQMGMQGLGYMHSDLGGFAGANLDDELYTRWLQYGVFQPIFRPHAQEEVPSEPVYRSEDAKAKAKTAIELRYQLLPYNYNLAFENNQKGTPLMRPLFFEEPDKFSENADTYLWGEDLLITPVLQPGQTDIEVTFPSTADWFDFYTHEKVEGGQVMTVKTNPDHIPTYVREGAFILSAQPIESTKDYNANDLILHYYHNQEIEESEREYYNDDGTTFEAYEKGEYELLEFEAEIERRWLEIDFEAENGENYDYNRKQILLKVHNYKRTPKKIKVNGRKVEINYKDNTLSIPVVWDTSEELKVRIKL